MPQAITLKQLPPLSGTVNERLETLLRSLNDVIGALTNNLSAPITLAGALAIASGAILPGTYTPTRTLVTNLDAAVSGQFMYTRMGNMVFAMGQISADATAGASAVTELGLTLPIASAFTAATQLLGGGVIDTGTSLVNLVVYADTTNDRAHVYWYSPGTGNYSTWIWFMYEIL